MHQNQMSKINVPLDRKRQNNKRERMTFFEIVLNKYWSGVSTTWESKVLHTTTTDDSSPKHLNEDRTEAPFLSLKLTWRFCCFREFLFPFRQKLHNVFSSNEFTLRERGGVRDVTILYFKLKYLCGPLDLTGS